MLVAVDWPDTVPATKTQTLLEVVADGASGPMTKLHYHNQMGTKNKLNDKSQWGPGFETLVRPRDDLFTSMVVCSIESALCVCLCYLSQIHSPHLSLQ